MNLFDQRGVFGEFARLMFAVDHFAVDLDVKDTATSGNHFAVNADFFLNVCRQTDGHRFIVSLHAVFDRNVHHPFSSPLAVLKICHKYSVTIENPKVIQATRQAD